MISNNNEIEEKPKHRSLEKMSYAEKGRFYQIRQILNILFILLAIIGMVLYFFVGHALGGVLLLAAVFIKIAECVFRIIP